MRQFSILTVLSSLLLLTSCATYMEPLKTERARYGPVSPANIELRTLPPPSEKIYTAVYKFRDQTGQYKASSSGSTFSTAVTQGATSILISALEQSGWFVPIEREGLSNLLNERKIIRSSRAEFVERSDEKGPSSLLPPLLFAGILIEGGIISYETNVLSGGAGLKYFGTGASGKYRQDRVTIYLRAVSTQNGRILKTVYTSKTILSQMVDVGLYKFVNFQRLLEAEIGYSYNEPPELCVTEAIEKGVKSLVIEGVLDGLWALKTPSDVESLIFTRYRKEVAEGRKLDPFGHERHLAGALSMTLFGGAAQYSGDYGRAAWDLSYGLAVGYDVLPDVSVEVRGGGLNLEAQRSFSASVLYADIGLKYAPLRSFKTSPFLFGGGSYIMADVTPVAGMETGTISISAPGVVGGAGLDLALNPNIRLVFGADYHYVLDDTIDNLEHGEWYDSFWNAWLGVSFRMPR